MSINGGSMFGQGSQAPSSEPATPEPKLWTTNNEEKVGVGDTVAVYHLDYADARGLIERAFLGQIDIRLTYGNGRSITRRVLVDEDQLLMKVDPSKPHYRN